MTTTAIRARLYDYIRDADDEKIKEIYDIMLEDKNAEVSDWSLHAEFVADLDERVRRYDEGIDPGRTWEDVQNSIDELKRKRSAK